MAFLLTSLAAFAGDPNGTWKFKAEVPGGRSVDSTLVLKGEAEQLTGKIENRMGKADLSNGKFADDQVSFTVLRKVRGKELTINYSGKLFGDTIKGTIQTTGREGKPVSLPWEAVRAK